MLDRQIPAFLRFGIIHIVRIARKNNILPLLLRRCNPALHTLDNPARFRRSQRSVYKIILHINYNQTFISSHNHKNNLIFLIILSAISRAARCVGCTPSNE